MRKLLATVAIALAVAVPVTVAHATQPDPEHKVGLCHRTASDTNPYVYIEVDEASLDAHLNNLPGHPAKVWKTDGTFRGVAHVAGDLKSDYVAESAEDCVDNTEPTPTPTPTPTDSPTPSPSTQPPTCHDDGSCFTPTWTPTWHPTGGPGPGNHPLAHTGFTAGGAAAAAGGLTLAGLAALYAVRRKANA